MKLILLGTGAARPDAKRAPPSQVIMIDDEPLLVDCGGGTGMSLMKKGVSPSKIHNIFFTHLHIDHCVEYPSIVFGGYLVGRTKEVNVYGPNGTEDFSRTLFEKVYPYAAPLLQKAKGVEMKIIVTEVNSGLVCETEKWKVTTTPVEHGNIDTLAYRIDSGGRSIVISGDTGPCINLIQLARDADILVHECSFPDSAGEKRGHTIPRQLGEIAKKAKVKKVVLTHLFPPCNGHEKEMVESVRKNFSGEVIVGEDLMEIYP
jgi:ribonuclease Z